MTKLGIITGIAMEAKLLERFVSPSLMVDYAGLDPSAAHRAAEKMIAAGATALLSFGLAGGLNPAVSAGAVRKNEPENVQRIEATMRRRIASVLAIAKKHEHRALVLGAWGCGVFRNDPAEVARWFRDALMSSSFDRVVFAVLDSTEGAPTYNAFRTTFAE